MPRVLALAAAVGLAAVTALPASAASATLTCVSLDTRCQTFVCTSGYLVNTGYTDTGPWVVVCNPV